MRGSGVLRWMGWVGVVLRGVQRGCLSHACESPLLANAHPRAREKGEDRLAGHLRGNRPQQHGEHGARRAGGRRRRRRGPGRRRAPVAGGARRRGRLLLPLGAAHFVRQLALQQV